MQDECNQLGIRTIFVIDSHKKLTLDDDEAVKILKENHYSLSRVIEGIYGNPGSARNAALNLIQTPWITFWDADDVPCPEKYLESIQQFPSANVIVGGYELTDGRNSKTIYSQSLMDVALNPGIWRIIFNASLFRGKQFPPLSMGEDQLLLIDLDLCSLQIEFANDRFYQYQTNVDGQLTKSETALKDLSKSLALSRDMIKSSSGDMYKSIVAVRLLLTYLKQNQFMVHEKVLTISKYLTREYLKALAVILLWRISRNG